MTYRTWIAEFPIAEIQTLKPYVYHKVIPVGAGATHAVRSYSPNNQSTNPPITNQASIFSLPESATKTQADLVCSTYDRSSSSLGSSGSPKKSMSA